MTFSLVMVKDDSGESEETGFVISEKEEKFSPADIQSADSGSGSREYMYMYYRPAEVSRIAPERESVASRGGERVETDVLPEEKVEANDVERESSERVEAERPEKEEEEEVGVTKTFQGTASWYGAKFHGSRTASGEVYDQHQKTAAHPDLPFGTRVRVTFLGTGKSTVVRINDRGPFVGERVIDLSYAAAEAIGLRAHGIGEVRVEVLGD